MEDSIFEIDLDPTELKFLKSILPQFYSLQEVIRTKPKTRKGSVRNDPSVKALTTNNEEANRRFRRNPEPVEVAPPPRSSRGAQLRSIQVANLKLPNDAWLEKSLQILDKIAKDGRASPFQLPVAQLYGDLPDYSTIVKNPMDISTVRRRILRGHYTGMEQFVKDMRLIWDNTYLYNDEECEVYQSAKYLSAQFEKLLQGKADVLNSNPKTKELIDVDDSQGKITPKKIRRNQQEKKVRSRSTKTVIAKKEYFSNEKKVELLNMINKIKNLDISNVNHIYRIVSKYNHNLVGKSEYEIDLEKLPTQALEELFEFSTGRLKSMDSGTIVSLAKVVPQKQEKKRPFDQSALVQHGSRFLHQAPREFNRASLVPQPSMIGTVAATPDKKDISKLQGADNKNLKDTQTGNNWLANTNQQALLNSNESLVHMSESNFKSGFDSDTKIDRTQESPSIHHFASHNWGGQLSSTELGTPNQINHHRPSNFFAGPGMHSMMQSSGVGIIANSKMMSYQSPPGYLHDKMKSSIEMSLKPESNPAITQSTPKRDANKSDDSSSSFLTEIPIFMETGEPKAQTLLSRTHSN